MVVRESAPEDRCRIVRLHQSIDIEIVRIHFSSAVFVAVAVVVC